jgi:hypothetical protein
MKHDSFKARRPQNKILQQQPRRLKMSATPTKWYFRAWLSDIGVRACSLAARGLWIDLLAIASGNKNREYGYVMIAGQNPTPEQISRLINSSPEEVKILLDELEENRVFSRDERKIIYSRRMVRSRKMVRTQKNQSRLGGNHNLLNKQENQDLRPQNKNPTALLCDRNGENPNLLNDLLDEQESQHPLIISPSPLFTGGGEEKPHKEKEERKEGRKEDKIRKKEAASGGSARGAVLPDDWCPADRSVALGWRLGLAEIEIQDEADVMRAWATANAHRAITRKSNWDAAFDNFLRRRAKEGGGRNGKPRPTSPAGHSKTLAEIGREAFAADRARKAAADNGPDGGSDAPIFDLLSQK